MKALLPALGTHPSWCSQGPRCRSTIAGDGTVETMHDFAHPTAVEIEHHYRYPMRVELAQLDSLSLGGDAQTWRSIIVDGEHASFGLTPRQAVALAWALLRAAARMALDR